MAAGSKASNGAGRASGGSDRKPRALGEPSAIADRRGGPANFGGVGYQVKVQVYYTLQWLAEHRNDPAATAVVRCEPRLIVEEGQFGYDIGMTGSAAGPDKYREVKRNPSAAEVDEFVARLSNLPDSGRESRFGLVVESETTAIRTYKRLFALAGEAVDDDELRATIAATGDDDLVALLERVGEGPKTALRRGMEPDLLPDNLLDAAVHLFANTVAAVGQADVLVARLVATFVEGSGTRRSFPVEHLVAGLVSDGVLAPPVAPAVAPEANPEQRDLQAVLVVLETSPVAVPAWVLAEALKISVEDLAVMLADAVSVGAVVEVDDGYARVAPSGQLMAVEFGLDLIVAVLKVTSAVAVREKADAAGLTPVAYGLAKRCPTAADEVIADLFRSFDKASKAWGDLWVTFELAKISNEALLRLFAAGLTDDQATRWGAVRAQTYICGQSWVYQRVDQLDDAISYMGRADVISLPRRREPRVRVEVSWAAAEDAGGEALSEYGAASPAPRRERRAAPAR